MTSPPIIWQSCRLITRPSPVPPYLRVVEASAWAKALKSLASCSGLRPIPVSITRKRIQGAPLTSVRSTSRVTRPFSVNLAALLMRFSRTWRTRV